VLFVLVDQRFALSKSANNFLKVSPAALIRTVQNKVLLIRFAKAKHV